MKVAIYSPSREKPVEPQVLMGSMRLGLEQDAVELGESFRMKKSHARYLLEAVHDGVAGGTHRTKTRIGKPTGAKKGKLDRPLHVTLWESPTFRPLHDFQGPEAVTEAAAVLKECWLHGAS